LEVIKEIKNIWEKGTFRVETYVMIAWKEKLYRFGTSEDKLMERIQQTIGTGRWNVTAHGQIVADKDWKSALYGIEVIEEEDAAEPCPAVQEAPEPCQILGGSRSEHVVLFWTWGQVSVEHMDARNGPLSIRTRGGLGTGLANGLDET
jgi:hypothetical protein